VEGVCIVFEIFLEHLLIPFDEESVRRAMFRVIVKALGVWFGEEDVGFHNKLSEDYAFTLFGLH
jgi:hypothetical protein